jgi:hypothetical protein
MVSTVVCAFGVPLNVKLPAFAVLLYYSVQLLPELSVACSVAEWFA